MISQTADHALRAVLCLAAHHGQALTAQQVGEETGVGGAYLAKIFQQLGKAGLVTSQRGLGGGFSLAVAPDHLTLMDVITAIDSTRRLANCPTDGEEGLCPLHRRLDEAAHDMERTLHAVTVADVVAELDGKPLHAKRLVNHG